MNISFFAGAGIGLLAAIAPAHAIDNSGIERLATCQDSWLDWQQSDPASMKKLVDSVRSEFSPGSSGAFVPKSSRSALGFPVAQVFPQSVGMAVGFSVVVNANFERTKRALEARIGKRFKCEPPSDNMQACELPFADKKTVVLMAEDNARSARTLFGCYYFYEK